MRTKIATVALIGCLVAPAVAVLTAAPTGAAPLAVAVWNDPAYVDSATEGANLIDALEAAGATVTEFTGVSQAAWDAGLAGADVAVIPETEVGNPTPALAAGAKTALSGFVNAGGSLLAFEPSFGNTLAVVNDVFGFSIASSGDGACPCTRAATAAGTPYAAGPATLPGLSATGSVTNASLPVGSAVVYTDDSAPTTAAVAYIPVGSGSVTVLGPDSFSTMVGTTWEDLLALVVTGAAEVSIDSVDVDEGEVATLTVTLDAAQGGDVDVVFSTDNGTAEGPTDFTPLASTVTIPAGETSATIEIETVEDTADEAAETFSVIIETSTPGVVVVDDVGTVTIADDDATPPGGAPPAEPAPVAPTFTG